MTKNRGKTKNKAAASGPAPGVAVFNGPVRMPEPSRPNDTITVRMSYVNTSLTGGSGGVQVATNNLQVTTCTDWASYAATYSEYRVLGFALEYLPNYPGGNAAVVHASGIRFTDHSSDSFVQPTLDVCVQHANWLPFYTGVSFKEEWKMASLEEATFFATAVPDTVLRGQVYATAPGASSSSSYANAVITFAVQFRDRK